MLRNIKLEIEDLFEAVQLNKETKESGEVDALIETYNKMISKSISNHSLSYPMYSFIRERLLQILEKEKN
jgi:hypothetical protein